MYRQQRVYNKYQRIGKSTLFLELLIFHTESNQSNITTKLSRTCLPKIDKKTHKKSDLQKNYTRLLVWFSVALDFWEPLN